MQRVESLHANQHCCASRLPRFRAEMNLELRARNLRVSVAVRETPVELEAEEIGVERLGFFERRHAKCGDRRSEQNTGSFRPNEPARLDVELRGQHVPLREAELPGHDLEAFAVR